MVKEADRQFIPGLEKIELKNGREPDKKETPVLTEAGSVPEILSEDCVYKHPDFDYREGEKGERFVVVNGEQRKLTKREDKLLNLLRGKVNRRVTHEDIIQGVWNGEFGYSEKNVRVLMTQLRKKINLGKEVPSPVKTVPYGYTLEDRSLESPVPVFHYSGFDYCPEESTIKVNGETRRLSPHENRLLELLAGRPDQPLTKGEIAKGVWDYERHNLDSNIRRLIVGLRSKVEPYIKSPQYILSVPGVGYKLHDLQPQRLNSIS